jgi:hypothetical protein
MGVALGAAVGVAVGAAVGAAVGVAVGASLTIAVGSAVGAAVGVASGSVVGVGEQAARVSIRAQSPTIKTFLFIAILLIIPNRGCREEDTQMRHGRSCRPRGTSVPE